MIANNIFRAIGEFFTWAFGPLEWIRKDLESWTIQNTINWIFIIIGMVLLTYWMGQLMKFKKEGTE